MGNPATSDLNRSGNPTPQENLRLLLSAKEKKHIGRENR
jgi:hypothetical protein